jgi:histidyl-tRNA synthetase
MKIEPRTLKGFRDFLPQDVRKRQYVIQILKKVFESYGFEPLETPSLEYADVLKGKYGEEEKLMYELTTKGGDEAALRYDQTVPLARVVAQYPELPKPFKRYQIQSVFRGENTQKGRYREFVQCDADVIGSTSPLADAEILALVLDIYKVLGLDVMIKINDRANFETLDKKYVAAIDKLEKIGESAVLSEMIEKGMDEKDAKEALASLQNKFLTDHLRKILDVLKSMGKDISKISYEPTLARGLDYYTGMIFETIAEGSSGSLCSGGRYDNLIGTFGEEQIPAVGFGLGFDRTIEILEEKNLLPDLSSTAKILVTIFNETTAKESQELAQFLREQNIKTDLYLGEDAKLEKQLKYADKKQIPFVAILGPQEIKDRKVNLKNLQNGSQITISQEELINALT